MSQDAASGTSALPCVIKRNHSARLVRVRATLVRASEHTQTRASLSELGAERGVTAPRNHARFIGQTHLSDVAQTEFNQITGCQRSITPNCTSVIGQIAMILTPDHRTILTLVRPKNDSVHVFPPSFINSTVSPVLCFHGSGFCGI